MRRETSWIAAIGAFDEVPTTLNPGAGTSTWSLTAPNGNGPEIPCMATLLLAERLAAGTLTARGAMPCMGLLTLDAFTPHFARWGMQTRIDIR